MDICHFSMEKKVMDFVRIAKEEDEAHLKRATTECFEEKCFFPKIVMTCRAIGSEDCKL